MFDGATNIRLVSLADAEKHYVSLSERANETHVMLVLYAPWCKYCVSMESEVRRLAKGLTQESDRLSILALDCNAPATRYFAKHVLGVPSLPAFCIFPKNSRTFYKYKGVNRDAPSLLKFVNMVCNQNEERLWSLSPSAGEPSPVIEDESNQQAGSTKIVSISQNPDPAADERALTAIGIPADLVPHVTIAARISVGIALLIGTYFIIKSRQQGSALEAKVSTSQVVDLKDEAAPGELARPVALSPMQQLVSDIDSTIGRMWGVMMRLVKARIGLALAPIEDDLTAPSSPQAKLLEENRSTPSSPSPPSPSAIDSTSTLPLNQLPPLPKPSVSAEQVLAMLDKDGGDVGKVIEKLMLDQQPNPVSKKES